MKFRAKLETEGVPTVHGLVMAPGALYMGKDVIPVVVEYDYANVVGRASNLVREGDEVFIDIDLKSGESNRFQITGYSASNVDRSENNILKAKLSAVSASLRFDIGKVEL